MIYYDREKKYLVPQFYQLLWLVYGPYTVYAGSENSTGLFIPSLPLSPVFSPWAKSFFRSKKLSLFHQHQPVRRWQVFSNL